MAGKRLTNQERLPFMWNYMRLKKIKGFRPLRSDLKASRKRKKGYTI